MVVGRGGGATSLRVPVVWIRQLFWQEMKIPFGKFHNKSRKLLQNRGELTQVHNVSCFTRY